MQWSADKAHNLVVVGSNPTSVTNYTNKGNNKMKLTTSDSRFIPSYSGTINLSKKIIKTLEKENDLDFNNLIRMQGKRIALMPILVPTLGPPRSQQYNICEPFEGVLPKSYLTDIKSLP